MGIAYVEGTVTGPTGKETTTEFLVDGGAKYTLLPLKNWKVIGLRPDLLLCLRTELRSSATLLQDTSSFRKATRTR
jgi:hypothetical protein